MDGGAWWVTVHGVAQNQTQLSDFTFTFISYHCSKPLQWLLYFTGIKTKSLQWPTRPYMIPAWAGLLPSLSLSNHCSMEQPGQLFCGSDQGEPGECMWTTGAREFQKNIDFCFIDYAKAFDCVDHNKLWEILKEMWIPNLPLEKSVCRSGSNS